MEDQRRGPRDTVDRYLALDIRKLDRLHLSPDKLNVVHLEHGNEKVGSIMVEVLENGNIVLQYSTEEREELTSPTFQPITISRSPCKSGGERRWFLCPRCDRRVAILYSKPYFKCRHCLGLPYASQRQLAAIRRLSQVVQQRRKLGGSGIAMGSVSSEAQGYATNNVFKPKRRG
jgi:hypothetical protein